MLFNSLEFLFVFLPIAYLVFWRLPNAQWRYAWLTITGYVFYSYWNPWFTLLMAFTTLVSYFAGLGFLRYHTPIARRLCLIIPIVCDLSILGFFKYANFGIETAQVILDALGTGIVLPKQVVFGDEWKLRFADIILPVGISFYTFHTISYIVDAYRGQIKPTKNFFEFAAYVSLFSQLVAGPIVRFRQIESDLENLGNADRTRWLPIGASFFIFGLIEKVLVADTLAAFVDPAFKQAEQLSTLGAWSAALGYTFQLLFDFSGYSSMAIGLGFMFGLRIPINFNSPYQALDPSDFWRRWHISLSTCIRDYIYVPLGGSRGTTIATYRNLMLTMLIGGLWHGANMTFLVWGAYHGALLCAYKLWGRHWDKLPALARQMGMFFFVMIGWVFFRSDNLSVAMHLLHTMFVPTGGEGIARPGLFLVAMTVAWIWALAGNSVVEMHKNFTWRPRLIYIYAGTFGACLAIVTGGRNSPFLYFQF